ncbi:C40 family peptidase [Flavobacteriaceae bacterium TP-CH-4]|uniref:C40 family peptidase n=2 Tax=Pelagihabitans pacificus TaxID=2696054 RepID=A0A967ARN3_9FLAO|nr:C40 family peptidase [Pelagihabitans pacificus]
MISCGNLEEKAEKVLLEEQISTIKNKFAPDKRVALFQVEAVAREGKYLLKGESNLPEAVSALKKRLSDDNIDFIDSIQLLPSADLEGKTRGLITISVANLRSNPKHSAELATQATLGTPIKIYKKKGDWSLIQTPDGYLAWVDDGGIVPLTEDELERWKITKKIIYTETYGHVYERPDKSSQPVSDVVAGNVLELLDEQNDFYAVKYPDGRIGYVDGSKSQPYQQWLESMEPSGESLVTTSKQLMGIPYLWGGTSTKGVDCSGFTKTVFFLNGLVIPRDASQQVHTGIPIDSIQSFDLLEKGDLLFFGRKATDSTREKVVHVGMWIGDNQFIHSSGKVRISSMDNKADNYDEFNRNRYLRSKRVLKQEDKGLISLVKTPLFKE